MQFWLSNIYETARRSVSIFSIPKRKIILRVNKTVRAPEGVRNNSLGQNYEKTSFDRRLVGDDRHAQRGNWRGCPPAGQGRRVYQWRRSLQELFVSRRLSWRGFRDPFFQLLQARM